jgi:hypothetical protein
MENFKETIQKVMKPVSNWVLFIVSCILSFFVGYFYPIVNKALHEEPTKFIKFGSLKETSISVTDRGELLIINRVTGKYDVYDESIGLSIFKAYGTHITNNQPK